MRALALLLSLLALPALAQTPGSVNLFGPSTVPGAPQVTPAAVNAAVNAALALKSDVANPVFTGTVHGAAFAFTGNGTVGGTLGVTGASTFTGALSGAGVTALLAPYAPLNSPVFTGTISGSGITALLAPYAPLASPTFTGTVGAVAITATGKISTPASAAGSAGFILPHGAAPTSPANGDLWTTSADGLFLRVNGTTKGPFISTITAPLTDTNGTIALGAQPGAAPYYFDTTVTVHNDTYQFAWPYATGTITSVEYFTGGSTTPSFVASVQIAGVNVTSCNGLTVNSATPATTTCTAANTITTGQLLSLVITSTSGSPFSSLVQINYTRSAT
jgi:hypothetical protein